MYLLFSKFKNGLAKKKNLNRHFPEEEIQMSNKHLKRFSVAKLQLIRIDSKNRM